MNSNSRNNSVSILSDEASALLRREDKYCSDVFDEDVKAPNASSISTPPHRGDRERMSSPVCIATDISSHFDKESRGKFCDWMYRVSKIRQQVIYVIIVSSFFVRTVFLMFHLTHYFCDTLTCYITPFNRLSIAFH